MNTSLTDLFQPPPGLVAEQNVMNGQLTAINTTTGANTVVVAAVSYTNLPIIGPLTGITTGAVLLLNTVAGPIIIGKLITP